MSNQKAVHGFMIGLHRLSYIIFVFDDNQSEPDKRQDFADGVDNVINEPLQGRANGYNNPFGFFDRFKGLRNDKSYDHTDKDGGQSGSQQ